MFNKIKVFEMKEYTFRAINSYFADTEGEAWEQLQADINSDIKKVFELVGILKLELGKGDKNDG